MRNLFSMLLDSCLGVRATSKRLFRDDTGQDLIEYAIMCALIAGLVIALSGTLSGVITNAYTTMGDTVNSAISNS